MGQAISDKDELEFNVEFECKVRRHYKGTQDQVLNALEMQKIALRFHGWTVVDSDIDWTDYYAKTTGKSGE